MSDHLETVKVRAGNGYAIINKSDFDPARHDLVDDEKVDQDPALTGIGSIKAGLAVVVPANWREMPRDRLMEIAGRLAPERVKDFDDAKSRIAANLEAAAPYLMTEASIHGTPGYELNARTIPLAKAVETEPAKKVENPKVQVPEPATNEPPVSATTDQDKRTDAEKKAAAADAEKRAAASAEARKDASKS